MLQVHIQAFTRKLSGSLSGARGAHIQAFGQKLAHVLGSLVRVAHPLNKRKRVWRCVMNVLVAIPACSHQRPDRHAHCRLWYNGVPVLHVEPIRARPRQLRVVVQELKQDDDEVVAPHSEPQHVDTGKNKSANLGKRDD